jgi:hypothetical protein
MVHFEATANLAMSQTRDELTMRPTFHYLLDKISSARFSHEPFDHLEILDFLLPEHFRAIVDDRQIRLNRVRSIEELLESLEQNGYQIMDFPGCVTSKKEYLDWYYGSVMKTYHAATESFGMVFRLCHCHSELISGLAQFFESEELKAVLVQKFGITRPVRLDTGIQKYLHGYEISPHPDVRLKALTWMLNLNPGENTEYADYHTHYLRFKNQWRFISEFWRYNEEFDRDWVPWDWCETVKRQRENNSIVFFSPSNDTLHAVKANYDNLKTQRTQLYGNLWYKAQHLPTLPYQSFDIGKHLRDAAVTPDRAAGV